MLKKAYALGLLSATVLSSTVMGMIALPAQAGDTAVVQTTTSDIYVEGVDNVGVQSTTQVNRTTRRNGRGSTATVQDAYTGGTVLGVGNEVYQEQTQINVTEEINRPRRGRGRARHGRRGGNINVHQH